MATQGEIISEALINRSEVSVGVDCTVVIIFCVADHVLFSLRGRHFCFNLRVSGGDEVLISPVLKSTTATSHCVSQSS